MIDVRSTARRIVRDAAKLDRSGFAVAFALRCTVGVAIPLIVAAISGGELAGVSAAYGALVTGFASRQGMYRTRAIGMILTALALALSGFAGAVSGPYPIANIVLAGVWAAMFGLIAAVGRASTVASINAVVAFVIFSNPPYDGSNPAFQALMVVAGGVLQTLLLVLVWPLQRYRTERRVLAAAYRALARYADHVNADDLGLPDAASLGEVRAALADPQPFGSRNELAAFEILADEAERLRPSLAALTSDHHLLAEVGLARAADAIGRVATAASLILGALADAVDRGVEPAIDPRRWTELDAAVRDVETGVAVGAPSIRDARKLGAQVRSAWRAARAAVNGGVSTVEASPPVRLQAATFGDAWDTIRANLAFDSIYARHGVRLGVAIVIAIGIQRLVPLAHAQWIPLTVALVLRPDFSSTFTRGLARICGTIGGAVLASAIAVFHPEQSAYVILAIVFAGISYALFGVSYAVFSAAITGYVVFLLAFGGSIEHAAAIDRVFATAIGGLLALIAYVAWPTWARERVRDDLASLIEAQARYCALILQAFLGPERVDWNAMRDAQLASRRTRTNAEASVDQMKGEPVSERGISLAAAQGVLAASRRIGVASLTLIARIADTDRVTRPALAKLIGDLEAAFAAIVAALRDERASPHTARLREDQVALARAAASEPDAHWELLVAETDLFVESVDAIADLIRRR